MSPLYSGLLASLLASPATPSAAPEVAEAPLSEERAPVVGPAIAAVDLASASAIAAAGGLSVSVNAALASQYRFRGANLTGDRLALQGGIDLDHASGFYLGAWGARLGRRAAAYGAVELDVYGGWTGAVTEGVAADLGVIAYTFPDAAVAGRNFVELYGSLAFTLGPATAKAGLAWDPDARGFAFAGLVRDNLYLYSDLSIGVPGTPLTAKAHLGYTAGSRAGATNSGSCDWSIGASAPLFGPLTASLDYVDAAADVRSGPINPNRAGLVAKLSVNF